MALINFGYRVDMSTVDNPIDPSGYVVAYDLDGILKQKDYYGNISVIGGTGSGGSGSTASLNIFGATNSLPKFGTATSLTQSRYSDNGNSGSYGGNGSYVTFLGGGNSLLKIDRGQSNIDFSLGNPSITQRSTVNSSNTIGLDIISSGELRFMLSSTMSALIVATSGYLNIPITPATGSNSDKFLMRGASGSITQIDYNSVLYTTLTRAQVITKITNSTLVPGSSYRITDASPVHYGGTEIVLKAVANNKLDSVGIGRFYNPIYYNSGMEGTGIWTNISRLDVDTVTGLFAVNETITADNSAKAIIFGMVQNGEIHIEITSGDWSTAVSFIGDTNGGSANVLTANYIASVSIGDKVIWGGRVWDNLNGNLGTPPLFADLDLDLSEWDPLPYTDTYYYNEDWDIIEYDIDNDFLTSRYNVSSNIKVSDTYKNYQDNSVDYSGSYIPSIVAMQWGNYAIYGNNYGFQDITIIDSYFNLLNYRGLSFKHNQIVNSYYYNNYSEGTLRINNNTFDQFFSDSSKLISSNITTNRFSRSNLSSSIVDHVVLSNNTFDGNSGFLNTILYDSTNISANLFNSGFLSSTVLQSTGFISNSLNNSLVRFGDTVSDYLVGKSINSTVFNSVDFTINITAATIIFTNYSKEVITRQDGSIRIKYINNSDAQAVTALTT